MDQAVARLLELHPRSNKGFLLVTFLTALVELNIFQDPLILHGVYSFEESQKRLNKESFLQKVLRWLSISRYYSEINQYFLGFILVGWLMLLIILVRTLTQKRPRLESLSTLSKNSRFLGLFSIIFFYLELALLSSVGLMFDSTSCFLKRTNSGGEIRIEDLKNVESTIQQAATEKVLTLNHHITCNGLMFYLMLLINSISLVLVLFLYSVSFKVTNTLPIPQLVTASTGMGKVAMNFLTLFPLIIRNMVIWTELTDLKKQQLYLKVSAGTSVLLFLMALFSRPYLRRRSNLVFIMKYALLALICCLSLVDSELAAETRTYLLERVIVAGLVFPIVVKISKNILIEEAVPDQMVKPETLLRMIVESLYIWEKLHAHGDILTTKNLNSLRLRKYMDYFIKINHQFDAKPQKPHNTSIQNVWDNQNQQPGMKANYFGTEWSNPSEIVASKNASFINDLDTTPMDKNRSKTVLDPTKKPDYATIRNPVLTGNSTQALFSLSSPPLKKHGPLAKPALFKDEYLLNSSTTPAQKASLELKVELFENIDKILRRNFNNSQKSLFKNRDSRLVTLLILFYQDYLDKACLVPCIYSFLKNNNTEPTMAEERTPSQSWLLSLFKYYQPKRIKKTSSSLKGSLPELGLRILFHMSMNRLSDILKEPISTMALSYATWNFKRGCLMVNWMEDLKTLLGKIIQLKVDFVNHTLDKGLQTKTAFDFSASFLTKRKKAENLFNKINQLSDSKFVPSLILQAFYSGNLTYNLAEASKHAKEATLWKNHEENSFFLPFVHFESCVLEVSHEPNEVGKILWVTGNCHRKLGYQSQELVGGSVNQLIPEPICFKHQDMMSPSQMKGTLLNSSMFRDLAVKTKNGTIKDMSLSIKFNADLLRGLRTLGVILFPIKRDLFHEEEMVLVVDDQGFIIEINENAEGHFIKGANIQEYSNELREYFLKLTDTSGTQNNPNHQDDFDLSTMEELIKDFQTHIQLSQGVKIAFHTKENILVTKLVQFTRTELQMARLNFNEIKVFPSQYLDSRQENAQLYKKNTLKLFLEKKKFSNRAKALFKSMIESSDLLLTQKKEDLSLIPENSFLQRQRQSQDSAKNSKRASFLVEKLAGIDETKLVGFGAHLKLNELSSQLLAAQMVDSPLIKVAFDRPTTKKTTICKIADFEKELEQEIDSARAERSSKRQTTQGVKRTDSLKTNQTDGNDVFERFAQATSLQSENHTREGSRLINIHSKIIKSIEKGSLFDGVKGARLLGVMFLLFLFLQLLLTLIKYRLKYLIVSELAWNQPLVDLIRWVVYTGPTITTALEAHNMMRNNLISDDFFKDFFGETVNEFVASTTSMRYPDYNSIKFFDEIEDFRRGIRFPYLLDKTLLQSTSEVRIPILAIKSPNKAHLSISTEYKTLSLREAINYHSNLLAQVQSTLSSAPSLFPLVHNVLYEGTFKYLFPYLHANTDTSTRYFEQVARLYGNLHIWFELVAILVGGILLGVAGLFFALWKVRKDRVNGVLFQVRKNDIVHYEREIQEVFNSFKELSFKDSVDFNLKSSTTFFDESKTSRNEKTKHGGLIVSKRKLIVERPRGNHENNSTSKSYSSPIKLQISKNTWFSYGLFKIWLRFLLMFLPLLAFHVFYILSDIPHSKYILKNIQVLMNLNKFYNYFEFSKCALIDMASREGLTDFGGQLPSDRFKFYASKMKQEVFPFFDELTKHDLGDFSVTYNHYIQDFDYCSILNGTESKEKGFTDPNCGPDSNPWFNGNILKVAKNFFGIYEEIYHYLKIENRQFKEDQDFFNSPRIKAILNGSFRVSFIEFFYDSLIGSLSSQVKKAIHVEELADFKECGSNCNFVSILLADSKGRAYFYVQLWFFILISCWTYFSLTRHLRYLIQADSSTCCLLSPSLLQQNPMLNKILRESHY